MTDPSSQRKTKIFIILAVVMLALPIFYEIGFAFWYTHIHSLTIRRINLYPWEKTIPLKSSDTYPKETPQIISLNVRENRLSYCIEFFEKAKDIHIRGSGWTPSGKGVLTPCYEISDFGIKREMIDFLLQNKKILLNRENSIKLCRFAARHKEELKQIGNHDLFQGLVNSGVFNWIKSGKDPEVEWQKKYSSKNP